MLGANQKVTVRTRWRNPETGKDEFFSHVLFPCSWESKLETRIHGAAAAKENAFSVLIAQSDGYLAREAWEALPPEGKRQFFSLTPGDRAVLGEAPPELTASPSDAFTIKTVQDNAAAHKHGRHFLITGV